MKIERFDCGTYYDGGVMLDSDDGEYVYHKDYATLEAKCAALAVENAVLKDGILQASEDMEALHDDYALFSYDSDGEQMDELLRLCDAQDSIASLENVKTPATDAFLAEIERKAIRKFINSIEHILRDKLSPYDTEETLENMRIFLEEQGSEQ